MPKANFAKKFARRFERLKLDSSKFSEILYSNTTPDKFSIYQVKITFKHLSFARKVLAVTCIEVLNFSFFWFILDYKYQNNLS